MARSNELSDWSGQRVNPSGDDILVAYQTILFILADERVAALAATLSAANLSTTDVSKGYIASSAKGYVNSLLYQLLLDLENHRIIELTKILTELYKSDIPLVKICHLECY